MTDHFANLPNTLDAVDELLASPAAPAVAPANGYQSPVYLEPCKACRGTGRFHSWSGRTVGPCFKCKGAGKFERKTSPEARAHAKAARVAKDTNRQVENLEAFKLAQPEIYAWIQDNPGFGFAIAMMVAVGKYGYLTDNQLAACQRCIDANKRGQEARAALIANAPVVDTAGIDRLKAAFDKAAAHTAAKARGLTVRNPKITIGAMAISPAKATSANPGALYVKSTGEDRTYLGKIADGKFFASRDCTEDQKASVLKFVADPAEAAKVYGQETGVCCICNATLRSEWRLRGIGPICAEKFGW